MIVDSRLPPDVEEWRSGAPDLLVWDGDGYLPIDVKHHKTFDDGDGLRVSDLADPTPTTSEHHCLRAAGPQGRRSPARSLSGGCCNALGWPRRVRQAGSSARRVWSPGMSSTRRCGRRRPNRTTRSASGARRWRHTTSSAGSGVTGRPTPIVIWPTRRWSCWCRCGSATAARVGGMPTAPWDLEAGSGDASLLPGIGYRPWRQMRDLGVESRAEVAALDYPTARLGKAGVDLRKWLDLASDAPGGEAVADLNPRAKKQVGLLEESGILTADGVLTAIDSVTAGFDGAGFLPGSDPQRPGRRPAPRRCMCVRGSASSICRGPTSSWTSTWRTSRRASTCGVCG